MALEVRSLSKNYGKVQALKNVSFKIGTGVYGLLGPNGAGKSTMIRIITGSMRASSGEVFYNGRRILRRHEAACAHRAGAAGGSQDHHPG